MPHAACAPARVFCLATNESQNRVAFASLLTACDMTVSKYAALSCSGRDWKSWPALAPSESSLKRGVKGCMPTVIGRGEMKRGEAMGPSPHAARPVGK